MVSEYCSHLALKMNPTSCWNGMLAMNEHCPKNLSKINLFTEMRLVGKQCILSQLVKQQPTHNSTRICQSTTTTIVPSFILTANIIVDD